MRKCETRAVQCGLILLILHYMIIGAEGKNDTKSIATADSLIKKYCSGNRPIWKNCTQIKQKATANNERKPAVILNQRSNKIAKSGFIKLTTTAALRRRTASKVARQQQRRRRTSISPNQFANGGGLRGPTNNPSLPGGVRRRRTSQAWNNMLPTTYYTQTTPPPSTQKATVAVKTTLNIIFKKPLRTAKKRRTQWNKIIDQINAKHGGKSRNPVDGATPAEEDNGRSTPSNREDVEVDATRSTSEPERGGSSGINFSSEDAVSGVTDILEFYGLDALKNITKVAVTGASTLAEKQRVTRSEDEREKTTMPSKKRSTKGNGDSKNNPAAEDQSDGSDGSGNDGSTDDGYDEQYYADDGSDGGGDYEGGTGQGPPPTPKKGSSKSNDEQTERLDVKTTRNNNEGDEPTTRHLKFTVITSSSERGKAEMEMAPATTKQTDPPETTKEILKVTIAVPSTNRPSDAGNEAQLESTISEKQATTVAKDEEATQNPFREAKTEGEKNESPTPENTSSASGTTAQESTDQGEDDGGEDTTDSASGTSGDGQSETSSDTADDGGDGEDTTDSAGGDGGN